MSIKYKNIKKFNEKGQELAIKFGLGAIKALGVSAMEDLACERVENGKFKDIYDLCGRLGKKIANKKTIEALAKSGSLDSIHNNRQQIVQSQDILTKFANSAAEERSSNQMNLFDINGSNFDNNPPLKKTKPWTKQEKLHNEFEAFGYFLIEHPISNYEKDLRARGVSTTEDIAKNTIEDNHIIYIAGVVSYSKHKTGPRGRYCYLTISDPADIIDISIFDENLISTKRDLIENGSYIVSEALVKKEDDNIRLLGRDIWSLDEFIKQKEEINCIKHTRVESKTRRNFQDGYNKSPELLPFINQREEHLIKKSPLEKVEIAIKNREEIINLKSILNQHLIKEKHPKSLTKVTLKINNNKLLLLDRFILDEEDFKKIKDEVR